MATFAAERRKLFPLRQRTGTASFHLSRDAVDFGFDDLDRLTPKEAVFLLAEARWGYTRTMPCAHCKAIGQHYWRAKEHRWKCKVCDNTFSVTSGTVLADRKLPLVKLLKIIFSWSNGSSGKPALQLRRDWNVSYPTVFTLLHKLREGLVRGFNVGVLCGVQEMDGMDVNGRRYREKRNKPQGGGNAGAPKIPAHLLKPAGEVMGPPAPHKAGKSARQPHDRRIMLVARQRGVAKGKGAVATRIAMAVTESSRTVIATARKFISAESAVMSDEDSSYASFGRLFARHETIKHSEAFSKPGGISNNQAESFNWRARRGAEGIYLNPSNKYLFDYSVEQAWREDTRRLSTGQRLRHLLSAVLKVGLSQWFRGYTHGHHRDYEFLVEGNREAKGRGRPEGWKAKPPR
jgi:transposase-like protein